jgi:hypothetical protein
VEELQNFGVSYSLAIFEGTQMTPMDLSTYTYKQAIKVAKGLVQDDCSITYVYIYGHVGGVAEQLSFVSSNEFGVPTWYVAHEPVSEEEFFSETCQG